MPANIVLNIRLSFEISEKEKWYVASCPGLDVFSQGQTEKQAEKNLREALCLFLTSCAERGTLDTVLKECGFRPVPDSDPGEISPEKYMNIPLYLMSDKGVSEQCRA